jgi:hypothetical protein
MRACIFDNDSMHAYQPPLAFKSSGAVMLSRLVGCSSPLIICSWYFVVKWQIVQG